MRLRLHRLLDCLISAAAAGFGQDHGRCDGIHNENFEIPPPAAAAAGVAATTRKVRLAPRKCRKQIARAGRHFPNENERQGRFDERFIVVVSRRRKK